MHRKMGNMMGEWLAFVVGLARDGLVGEHDIADERRRRPPAFSAGNDSTFVAASMPRQSRLSRRIAESSVRTIASSAPLVDSRGGRPH